MSADLSNRNIIKLGIFLKVAYCAVIFGHELKAT